MAAGDKGTKNKGLRVYIGTKAADASTDSYVQIKRCKAGGDHGPEAPIIDATAWEDAGKEKLKGTPDFGDMELTGNRVYGDPGQEDLLAATLDDSDTPYNIRIEKDGAGPAGANLRFTFKAMVSRFKTMPGAVDGLMEFGATVAISGTIAQTQFV